MDGKLVAYLTSGPENPNAGRFEPSRLPGNLSIWVDGRQRKSVTIAESAATVSLDAGGKHVFVTFGARRDMPAGLAVYTALDLTKVGSVDAKASHVVAAVSPTGDIVLAADGDVLWTRSVPDLGIVRMRPFPGVIQAVAFSPSGERYAVVDDSGMIAVFDAGGELVTSRRSFFQGSQRRALAFSPNGKYLGVLLDVSTRSSFRLIALQTGELDDQLCDRLVEAPQNARWQAILPRDSPPSSCPAGPLLLRM